MSNIPKRLRERAQIIKDRIYHAMRMYHNAHDNWSSEEIEPGVSYLDWIHAAIDDQATALHEIEQAARAEGERAGAERMREAHKMLLGASNCCVGIPCERLGKPDDRDMCCTLHDVANLLALHHAERKQPWSVIGTASTKEP